MIDHAFVEIHSKVDGFARELKRDIDRSLKGIEPDARRAGRSVDREIGGGFRRAGKDVDLFDAKSRSALRRLNGEVFNSNIRMREFAHILGGATLPALVSLGSIGVPAVLALSAALSSAAGSAAAIGPSLLAIGQGFGVVKLAFSGIGDAVKAVTDAQAKLRAGGKLTEAQLVAIQQKLNALSPAGRAFVKELAAMQGLLSRLRATAQRNLFPGLTSALDRLKVLFPIFNRIVGATGRALGNLADKGAKLITSGPWKRDFERIGKSNVRLIELFGAAGLKLADAFRNIIAAAGPMTESLARMVLGWANLTSANIEAARQSGKLGEFFDTAALNLRRLLRIAGNVGGILKAIFTAALPAGGELLLSLEKVTGRLHELATSTEGGRKLREFFEKARPAIETIAGLIGDFLRKLGGIALVIKTATERMAAFLDQHPALKDMLATVLALGLAFKALNVAGLVGVVASIAKLAIAAPEVALVVGIVLALAAAFTLAYFKIQPFRDAVDNTARQIKAAVVPALQNFAGFIKGEVIPALERTVPFIRDQLVAGLNFLKDSLKENGPQLRNFGHILLAVGKFIGTVVVPAVAMLAGVQLRILLTAIGLVIRVFSNWLKAGALVTAGLATHFRTFLNVVLTVFGGIVHGAAVIWGWVPGLGAKLKGADKAFQAMKNAVLATLASTASAARGFGRATGNNFADGLIAATGRVRASAHAIVGSLNANLKPGSPPREGPLREGGGVEVWGKRLAELFAEGLRSGVPDVRRGAGALAGATALNGAVRGAFQPQTPAGVRGAIAGQGIHIEQLVVQPLSGQFRLADIMQEVRLAGVH